MLSWGEEEDRILLTFNSCELWGDQGRSPHWVVGRGCKPWEGGVGVISTSWVPPPSDSFPPRHITWRSPTELGTKGTCPLASSGHFKTNSAVEIALL